MKQTLVLAFQAIFACFSDIVAVPLVVAGALGLEIADTSVLVSCALFASGLTTIVQAKGIAPIGSKLPFIMGTFFAFVSPAIAVGSAANSNSNYLYSYNGRCLTRGSFKLLYISLTLYVFFYIYSIYIFLYIYFTFYVKKS